MKYKSVAPRSLPTPCMFRMYKYIYIFSFGHFQESSACLHETRHSVSAPHDEHSPHVAGAALAPPWRLHAWLHLQQHSERTVTARSPFGKQSIFRLVTARSPHGHRTVTAWKSKRFQRCDKRACVCFQLLYSSERENALFSKR